MVYMKPELTPRMQNMYKVAQEKYLPQAIDVVCKIITTFTTKQ